MHDAHYERKVSPNLPEHNERGKWTDPNFSGESPGGRIDWPQRLALIWVKRQDDDPDDDKGEFLTYGR